MSFSVRTALTVDDHILRLQTPPSFWYKRGAVVGLLVPALLLLLVVLVALLDFIEVGAPSVLTAIAAGAGGLLSGIFVLWGAVHIIRAGARSEASLVELDLQAGTITSAAEGTHPIAAVTALELHQPRVWQKWHAISACLSHGPVEDHGDPYRAPADERVVLLGNINELEVGKANELMGTLSGHLGDIPIVDKSSGLLGGGGSAAVPGDTKARIGRLGHALAYLPVQGIFLIASVVLLVARRNDPVAQFHARQSLALLPLEIAALLLGIVVTVPFMLIPKDPSPLTMIPMLLVLLPIALGRLGLRLYAGWRAHKGECWVIPGIGWLSRRWLPEPSEA